MERKKSLIVTALSDMFHSGPCADPGANGNSEGNGNGIPGGRRTVLGARRRWHFRWCRKCSSSSMKTIRSEVSERYAGGERTAGPGPASALSSREELSRGDCLSSFRHGDYPGIIF